MGNVNDHPLTDPFKWVQLISRGSCSGKTDGGLSYGIA
jgi:hypothetical protein